jgi:predicted enzyme related to lactoylglutathione lyase
MNPIGIFAVVCVYDFEQGVDWYTWLFGRKPDERPMEWLAQWRFTVGGVQVWKDEKRAGGSLATVVVSSIAAERARLAEAGLRLGPGEGGEHGLVARIEDPDGNQIVLAEPPPYQAM